MRSSPVKSRACDIEAFDVVEPPASALLESLRAFGYSPRAAVDDLVDNSLGARAANISHDDSQ